MLHTRRIILSKINVSIILLINSQTAKTLQHQACMDLLCTILLNQSFYHSITSHYLYTPSRLQKTHINLSFHLPLSYGPTAGGQGTSGVVRLGEDALRGS